MEFKKAMEIMRMICNNVERNCNKCPLSLDWKCSVRPWVDSDVEQVEGILDKWDKTHPEPVYTTVAKYLEQFGIIIRRDGTLQADFFKANEPINEDIAKLLGISKGESENEKTD